MKWLDKDTKLTLLGPIQIYFRLVITKYHYTPKDTVKLFNISVFIVSNHQTSITVYIKTPAHIWITALYPSQYFVHRRQITETLATTFSLFLLYLIWRSSQLYEKSSHLSLEGSLYYQKKNPSAFFVKLQVPRLSSKWFKFSRKRKLLGKRITCSFIAIKFWSGTSQMPSKMHALFHLFVLLGNCFMAYKIKILP